MERKSPGWPLSTEQSPHLRALCVWRGISLANLDLCKGPPLEGKGRPAVQGMRLKIVYPDNRA